MVLLDVWLQGSRLDGLEILNILRERYPNLPVVIISGHGNIDTADGHTVGAYDFIEKPLNRTNCWSWQRGPLRRRVCNAKMPSGSAGRCSIDIGRPATAMEQLSTKIDKLSQTKSRVMIVGPSGSGKEAAAHHCMRAHRATGNFISAYGHARR